MGTFFWRRALAALTVVSLLAPAWVVNTGPASAGSGGDNPASTSIVTGDTIQTPTPVTLSNVCPAGARSDFFDVSAINVDITLNRFGDHDPQGRMYVLTENIPAVRAQEVAPLPDRVSTGEHGDAIQPLILRANLGDCLNIVFRNQLQGERASIHFHRGKFDPNNGGTDVGDNTDSTVAPGQSTTYTVYLENKPGMEGAFYFYSHGTRDQVMHGLFGAVIGEPPGSIYLDPNTGTPLKSGWEAFITNVDATVRAYRDWALVYHEIGDETYHPLDKDNKELPTVDPVTDIYRPCARALNYRSDCFMRRVGLTGDESLAYSSYNVGDPSTPMPRSYVGDPAKTHLIHGGSEMVHVHHLHGGADRWRLQGSFDYPNAMFQGLTKNPIDTLSASQRLDVQSLGPGEAYTLRHECGSGGCQDGAGEFLFHCHIPDHYLAGMWSMWRVYNTLQANLQELPDLAGKTAQAVNSLGLIGKHTPSGVAIDSSNIESWVESQLPPPGVANGYDATVWDWTKTEIPSGPLYMSEPEDTHVWPNWSSPTPGQRREIMFNPNTGLLAFPLLTPHLAKRPPFAPGAHGGAPYLTTPAPANELSTNSDFTTTTPDPMRGQAALCPVGAPVKRFNIAAITLPISLNGKDVDPNGMIFALAEEVPDILAGRKPAKPLVIRVNQGDCVMNTLVSQLVDNDLNGKFSKVNIHPHFFQFDTQASDGVISGFSYEQSVRPYSTENRVLSGAVTRGMTSIPVTNIGNLRPGIWIGVGLGTNGIELHKIDSINGNTISLTEPLVRDHGQGEAAGVEFVRYQYYADVQLGTVFIHDHVAGTLTWQHGLVGTIIVEPPGSTYHDPTSGKEVRSGPVADVHTLTAPCLIDCPPASFRELTVVMAQEHKDPAGNVTGWFNMRAEPFNNRGGDPSLILSSVAHGDPSTDVLRAYQGDPVVIRAISGTPNNLLDTFRVTGHTFQLEQYHDGSITDAIHIGIAERFLLALQGGAGKPGDYLYYDAEAGALQGGMWGIFRVHDKLEPDLQPLPDRPQPAAGPGFPTLTETGSAPPAAPDPGNVGPPGAPVRTVDVKAIEVKTTIGGQSADRRMFVLASDAQAVISGKKQPEPLVLRASAGEVLQVNLTNTLPDKVSLHIGRGVVDPQKSLGITVGYDYDQSVAHGQTRTYRVYVDKETGSGIVADFAQLDGLSGQSQGLFGSIVTAAPGSRFFDPTTGAEVSTGWRAVVRNVDPTIPAYRDYSLLFEEHDPDIGTNKMPYFRDVKGIAAINYRSEPVAERLKKLNDPFAVFSSAVFGDPATPLMEAYSGDPVLVHAIQGFGFQTHVFALDGHNWRLDPNIPGSTLVGARGFGSHEPVDAVLDGGAGLPGDYQYLNHRLAFEEAGQWGIFRVYGSPNSKLLPLNASAPKAGTAVAPGQGTPQAVATPAPSVASGPKAAPDAPVVALTATPQPAPAPTPTPQADGGTSGAQGGGTGSGSGSSGGSGGRGGGGGGG